MFFLIGETFHHPMIQHHLKKIASIHMVLLLLVQLLFLLVGATSAVTSAAADALASALASAASQVPKIDL